MFTIIYYLLALILYIIAIPYLLFKSRTLKYSKAIPAKFFFKNNASLPANKIWFHSCSQGETTALKPIFDEFENDELNLSVITNTGFAQGSKMLSNVRYLPFEIFLPFWIKQQKALVVTEAELWYMLFLVASRKGVKTYIINARINDKSYDTYKKYSFFYKRLFKNVDKIFAQSKTDKQRLEVLGATNIEVIGNIKLASLPKTTKDLIKPNAIIITAGSTHETEEALILDAWDKTQGKLIIVPRHPERFEEVFAMIQSRYQNCETTYSKYSSSNDFNSDITLVDVMGELVNIYAISDVVILGGGFIQSAGGHNPIEPAYFGCKLISGKVIFNQKSLFECVNNHYLISNDEIKEYLNNIENLKPSSIDAQGDIKPIIKELKSL